MSYTFPYSTTMATDVISPERSINYVKAKSPEKEPTINISCSGASNSFTVATYIKQELVNDPSLNDILMGLGNSLKATINGTVLDGSLEPDDVFAQYGIEMEQLVDAIVPDIEGYLLLGAVVWTNKNYFDVRVMVEYSLDNSDRNFLVSISDSPVAVTDLDGQKSYACLAAAVQPSISCEGAKSTTPCVNLNGLWDIEIDGKLMVSNATEVAILNAMSSGEFGTLNPTTVNAANCGGPIVCTPTGQWVFNSNARQPLSISEDSRLHMVVELSSTVSPDDAGFFDPQVRHYFIEKSPEGVLTLFNETNAMEIDTWENLKSGTGNISNYFDVLVRRMHRDISSDISPSLLFNTSNLGSQEYRSTEPSDELCVNDKPNYTFRLALQNVAAISKTAYQFYSWYGGVAGSFDYSYTGNTYKMWVGKLGHELNELESYTFTPTSDTSSVERAVLEHFASRLQSYDPASITCTILEQDWKHIPSAFGGQYGENINTLTLLVESTKPITILTPKQATGTAHAPQLENPNYGFDVNDPGFLASSDFGGYMPDSSGPRDAAFIGCAEGAVPPNQANYVATIVGQSKADLMEYNGTWLNHPVQARLLDFGEIDYSRSPTDINIIDLFGITLEQRTLTSCGYVEQVAT